jgi:hypothetical protein
MGCHLGKRIALHFYKRHRNALDFQGVSIHTCRRSNRHLVAHEGDFAIYDTIATPLCDAPRAPPPLCK